MKNIRYNLPVISAVLLLFSGITHAGVVGSVHDLTAATGTGTQTTAATTEVCVFCHTPHGSDTSAPAPLWNKILPAAGGFTLYDDTFSSSIDGTVDLAGSGISLACLSCHDGATAMDTVLNAPGSGNYNAAGIAISGGTMTAMTGEPIPNLSTDLTNDHPVGIQYAGGGLTWGGVETVAANANDKAFVEPTFDGSRMWVGGAVDGSLPLYRDTTNNEPLVECASCHDPHKTDNGTFLRISNAASAVCTSCHVK